MTAVPGEDVAVLGLSSGGLNIPSYMAGPDCHTAESGNRSSVQNHTGGKAKWVRLG
jgi:hypothetical protein